MVAQAFDYAIWCCRDGLLVSDIFKEILATKPGSTEVFVQSGLEFFIDNMRSLVP